MQFDNNFSAIRALQNDFTVVGTSIFADFPETFNCFEVLSAFQLPKLLFPNATNPERVKRFCINSSLVFLAVKTHILTMDLTYSETEKKLEMAVLNGDLLSGRFAKRMIIDDELDLLKEWLDRLLPFYSDLTDMSLAGVDKSERMLCCSSKLLTNQIEIGATHPSFGGTPQVVRTHVDDLAEGLVNKNWDNLLTAVSSNESLLVAAQNLIHLQKQYAKLPLNRFSISTLEAEKTI